MKPHWTVSVFSSCLWTAQGLSGPPNTTFCAVIHSWQFLAHILSLNARLVPVVVGFSWAFWGLCKQFIQVILKLMGTFSAWWDMKGTKWRNLTGQKIRLYINSGTALEVTIWISLEQEVKASLSDTITFVISASQAASLFFIPTELQPVIFSAFPWMFLGNCTILFVRLNTALTSEQLIPSYATSVMHEAFAFPPIHCQCLTAN